jgi:hypothetical protein
MRTIVAELLSVLLTTPDREVLVRSSRVKVRVTREKTRLEVEGCQRRDISIPLEQCKLLHLNHVSVPQTQLDADRRTIGIVG